MMDENPFPDTVIADWGFLDGPAPRTQCPKCRKSRKYYCYTCYVAVPHLSAHLPFVKLPVKVDIIKHPSEIDGKSTSPHAAVLAPEDVTIHTYPCIPDYDKEKVVLVFPCEQSITLEELAGNCSQPHETAEKEILNSNTSRSLSKDSSHNEPVSAEPKASHQEFDANNFKEHVSDTDLFSHGNDNVQDKTCGNVGREPQSDSCHTSHTDRDRKRKHSKDENDISGEQSDESHSKHRRVLPSLPFDRVVFIDSTWNQTRNIIGDERLKDLKKVELRSRNTNFWRCQEGIPKFYLSTIEAIYYFMKDLHILLIDPEYKHEYDNLLFFFIYMYNKIRNSSNGGKRIKAYQR